MDIKTIKDVIRATGLRPIESCWRGGNLNAEAREMIGRETNYYDPDTLRYFNCKVQEIGKSPNGVFMYTIAKQDRDVEGNIGYIATFHAFDGYRLGEEREYFSSLDKTRTSRDKILVELDELKVLVDAMKRIKATRERSLLQAKAAYNMLPRTLKEKYK